MRTLYLTLLFAGVIEAGNFQNSKEIAEYENVVNENGYHFRYKTDDSERSENGVFDYSKGGNGMLIVSGYYSFLGTDGKTYRVDYVADGNGYRTTEPAQNHLAKAQPKTPGRPVPFVPYIGSNLLGSLIGGGIG